MSWRFRLFLLMAIALTMTPVAFMTGCQELPTEGEDVQESIPDQELLMREQFDDEDVGVSVAMCADSVNAIGQRQHALAISQGGSQSSSAASWQLYVSVPFVSQNDSRWKNHRLGFGGCGSTIGRYGCLLSCLTMHYKKWGYNIDPRILNEWSQFGREHYAFLSSGCGDLIRNTEAISYPNVSRPWRVISYDEIYPQLAAGRPVVMKLRQDNGSIHFVVIYAFDGARYWCKDPWRTSGYDRPLFGTSLQARIYGYH